MASWLKIFRRSVDGGAEENAEEEKDDSEETRKGRARRAADGGHKQRRTLMSMEVLVTMVLIKVRRCSF